jgi:hypothetical protein
VALDYRQRPVHEVGGGEALGHDVAGLHQLERHLEGVGVDEAATDDHAVLHEDVALDELFDERAKLKGARGVFGDGFEVEPRRAVGPERVGQHVEVQELSRVRLRRRDRALAPAVHEERLVHDVRHRRRGLVRDADRAGPGGARVFEDAVDVLALARLRDADDERAPQLQARPVERVHRGRGERDGDAGHDFEQVAAEERGVVGRAARDEHDQINVARLDTFGEPRDLPALLSDGAFERGGLLRDLFKHQ